jgi:putative oxidoreductase
MVESYCREKLGPLVLRLALGLVCIWHGYLKIMAAGGTAWAPGLGVLWQVLLSWGEFTGGVAILFGFRCRIAAAVVIVCAIGQNIYFHGWSLLRQPPQALEPTLVVLLMGLALLFLGAGGLAVDARPAGARAFRRG